MDGPDQTRVDGRSLASNRCAGRRVMPQRLPVAAKLRVAKRPRAEKNASF
jgi:hypothetical protein